MANTQSIGSIIYGSTVAVPLCVRGHTNKICHTEGPGSGWESEKFSFSTGGASVFISWNSATYSWSLPEGVNISFYVMLSHWQNAKMVRNREEEQQLRTRGMFRVNGYCRVAVGGWS